mmetsp:Transcript_2186/g.6037  ORF Transcript_2186/g.6037 Transcript_2186/m.6037 type:complete len:337 (+) Transcript_2186:220-1230(+)
MDAVGVVLLGIVHAQASRTLVRMAAWQCTLLVLAATVASIAILSFCSLALGPHLGRRLSDIADNWARLLVLALLAALTCLPAVLFWRENGFYGTTITLGILPGIMLGKRVYTRGFGSTRLSGVVLAAMGMVFCLGAQYDVILHVPFESMLVAIATSACVAAFLSVLETLVQNDGVLVLPLLFVPCCSFLIFLIPLLRAVEMASFSQLVAKGLRARVVPATLLFILAAASLCGVILLAGRILRRTGGVFTSATLSAAALAGVLVDCIGNAPPLSVASFSLATAGLAVLSLGTCGSSYLKARRARENELACATELASEFHVAKLESDGDDGDDDDDML